MKEIKIEAVLSMLKGERFHKWYEGKFVDYIGGDENCATEEEILEDLKQLLRI